MKDLPVEGGYEKEEDTSVIVVVIAVDFCARVETGSQFLDRTPSTLTARALVTLLVVGSAFTVRLPLPNVLPYSLK